MEEKTVHGVKIVEKMGQRVKMVHGW